MNILCDFKNYQAATLRDILVFEQKLKNIGVENDIYRFITAGKNIGAGCGEFAFVRINQLGCLAGQELSDCFESLRRKD